MLALPETGPTLPISLLVATALLLPVDQVGTLLAPLQHSTETRMATQQLVVAAEVDQEDLLVEVELDSGEMANTLLVLPTRAKSVSFSV
jgi:hypothetical protein